MRLCGPLEIEDYGIQPMADASPPKWHLAHTSWFFETFLLKRQLADYQPFNPQFEQIYNSYYNGIGKPFPRAERGRLSRPTVAEVVAYREHVDAGMRQLLSDPSLLSERVTEITSIGLQHEQQHQELLLTDLKYNFGTNPLYPAYRDDLVRKPIAAGEALSWIESEGGLREIGRDPDRNFAFDNERPRHSVFVQPHALASRLVNNQEYLAFIEAGGYQDPRWWLADGWSHCQTQGWSAPLYWLRRGDDWFSYEFSGLQPLNPHAAVSHVSFYEADAFARWSGARLPTEQEWECAAASLSIDGNFVDSDVLQPLASKGEGLTQMYGDCWEWTGSGYAPYPGYRPMTGTLGEYNGKFMANQMVLRGGSCLTPQNHIRPSYRNFFYPPDRWQCSGIRLTRDL